MKPLIAILLSTLSATSWAAPKAKLWPLWNSSAVTQSVSISHQAWQEILDRYLITQGEYSLFRYSAVSNKDQQLLKHYIEYLSNIAPRTLTKPQQYAYWVNLYNAATVQLIIENYPVPSITKLGSWLSFGPWDEDLLTIQGQAITLNDIEHRILRPIWRDPRTHYAVNCASLGCPNLQGEAFTAENRERLLEQAAREFINSTKGAHKEGNQWVISSIYDWFSEDFGSQQALIQHLATYHSELADYHGKFKYEYNWQLNDQKNK
ncbi:DUF547 domain-containing protein [Vibrio fluvialis]|uniref:DUF547 domain-containing protein n=1 Tax=Vibrio fluvialis TaxID=676 RepID=UPI001EEAC5D4|nr:DUF547 domain-containing protein [Vibrio fluvialis]MCG6352179.1 DUF547 domain-containing protein [Vibrio fluvialis]